MEENGSASALDGGEVGGTAIVLPLDTARSSMELWDGTADGLVTQPLLEHGTEPDDQGSSSASSYAVEVLTRNHIVYSVTAEEESEEEEERVVVRPEDEDGVRRTYGLDELYHGELFLDGEEEWKKWQWGRYTPLCGGYLRIPPVHPIWWILEVLNLVMMGTMVCEWEKYTFLVIGPTLALFLVFMVSSCKALLLNNDLVPKPTYEAAVSLSLEVMRSQPEWLFSLPYKKIEGKWHRYCTDCHHFVPLETFHCRWCKACFIGQETHCPVFGLCVTQSNARSFKTMIGTGIVYSFIVYACSVVVFFNNMESGSNYFLIAPVLTEMLIGFVVCIIVLSYSFIPKILLMIERKRTMPLGGRVSWPLPERDPRMPLPPLLDLPEWLEVSVLNDTIPNQERQEETEAEREENSLETPVLA